MTVNAVKDGTKLTITAEGKLGTTSAPELEKAVKNNIDGVTDLVFDFAKLEYARAVYSVRITFIPRGVLRPLR